MHMVRASVLALTAILATSFSASADPLIEAK
jgi:hypothetical protein